MVRWRTKRIVRRRVLDLAGPSSTPKSASDFPSQLIGRRYSLLHHQHRFASRHLAPNLCRRPPTHRLRPSSPLLSPTNALVCELTCCALTSTGPRCRCRCRFRPQLKAFHARGTRRCLASKAPIPTAVSSLRLDSRIPSILHFDALPPWRRPEPHPSASWPYSGPS